MPVEHEANQPATQPDWAFISNGRLADGGPRYTETPPDPYAPGAPSVAEPFNAVTATFFIAIAGWWVWRLRGRYRHYPFLCCCLPILFAGGVGGTLYHALRTSRVYFLLDVIPISVLGLAGAVFLAVRLSRRWSWAYIGGSLIVYIAFNRLMFQMLPQRSIHWAINLSYASLALLILTPMAVVLVRTRFRHGKWVIVGFLSFVIAWFFRLVDQHMGPYLPMGSHWLWHTFGALTTAFIIEFFYKVEGDPKAEVPAPGETTW